MSGYDLKKMFDQSVAYFWTADQAQIYRVLARLAEDGLVSVKEIEQHHKPERKKHFLTKTAEEEFDAWLAKSQVFYKSREPFLLQIFFSGRMKRPVILKLLTGRIDAARHQLDALLEIKRRAEEHFKKNKMSLGRRKRLATLDNGIQHTKTEIKWAMDVRKELSSS